MAFGTFEDNPVLDCVCANCNHRFSRELEIPFARESGEGFARVSFGLRPNVFETSKNCVLTVQLPTTWEGARVHTHHNPGGGRPLFEVLPQVAFKQGNSWEWIIEDEISPERVAAYLSGLADVRVAYNSGDECERIIDKLRAVGISVGEVSHYDINSLSNERLRVVRQYELSHRQARCIAKIAFNYLAWNFGAKFVLNECFDEVRAYILRGDLCGQTFISLANKSILLREQLGGKAINGHILVVDWDSHSSEVIGYVTFFNLLHYNVELSRRYVGCWFPLSTGHHFDLATRKISKVSHVTQNEPVNL